MLVSTSFKYTGTTNAQLNWHVKGTFGFNNNTGGGVYGTTVRNVVYVQLYDVTTGEVMSMVTVGNNTSNCGAIVYPVGLGGCDRPLSGSFALDTYVTSDGGGITNGNYYTIRVIADAEVDRALGVVYGFYAETFAYSIAASASWS